MAVSIAQSMRPKRKTMTEVYMEEMARKRGPLFENSGEVESTKTPYQHKGSDRNKQIIDLKYLPLTNAEIGQRLGLKQELINTVCYRAKLKTYKLGRKLEADIYRDCLKGKSVYEIAKARHIAGMTVEETIRIVGRVITILKLRRAGYKLKEIVPHVGCNMRTVSVMIQRWENKDEIADLL